MQTINSNIPYIQVYNGGGYVAKLDVYYKKGIFTLHQSTGQMSVGMTRKLFIPDDATKLELYFRVADCGWVLMGIEKFDKMDTLCFSMWGTIFSPGYQQVECNLALMRNEGLNGNLWESMKGQFYMPCRCNNTNKQ